MFHSPLFLVPSRHAIIEEGGREGKRVSGEGRPWVAPFSPQLASVLQNYPQTRGAMAFQKKRL